MSGKEVILRTPGSTLLTLLAWSYKVIFVPEGSNIVQWLQTSEYEIRLLLVKSRLFWIGLEFLFYNDVIKMVALKIHNYKHF